MGTFPWRVAALPWHQATQAAAAEAAARATSQESGAQRDVRDDWGRDEHMQMYAGYCRIMQDILNIS